MGEFHKHNIPGMPINDSVKLVKDITGIPQLELEEWPLRMAHFISKASPQGIWGVYSRVGDIVDLSVRSVKRVLEYFQQTGEMYASSTREAALVKTKDLSKHEDQVHHRLLQREKRTCYEAKNSIAASNSFSG
eukprot:gb/GECG01012307.1/.p1 GENE.gb/GECG01012307.1/~~gb/GECG01012307.1/.p1  ORF type:complete len:133 (+),score=14.27 gb/GECG01012307.1/:1-399(+)